MIARSLARALYMRGWAAIERGGQDVVRDAGIITVVIIKHTTTTNNNSNNTNTSNVLYY